MKKRILSLFIIILGTYASSFACDYCLLTQGISPLETSRGIGLRIDERFTRLGTLFDHGQKIDASEALETHWTTQLTAFYTVHPRLTLIGVVPFARRFERAGEEGDHHHDDEAFGAGNLFKNGPGHVANRLAAIQDGPGGVGSSWGLSDITLLGRFQAYQRHSLASTFIASVQAGVRIPTGKTDATNDEGEVLNAHIQPGTGSFSYLFGVSTSYAFKKFNAVANSVFSIATEGEVGDDSYEFGNAINYDASVRYRLRGSLQSSANLFAAIGIAGEWRQKERLNKAELDGTGGNTLYLTPGFQVFFRSVVFEFSFWQAISRDLNGEQLGETFKTFAGLTFLLK